MLNKVFLAAAVPLIMAGATMTVSSAPAMACGACHKAAKAPFPDDKTARGLQRALQGRAQGLQESS